MKLAQKLSLIFCAALVAGEAGAEIAVTATSPTNSIATGMYVPVTVTLENAETGASNVEYRLVFADASNVTLADRAMTVDRAASNFNGRDLTHEIEVDQTTLRIALGYFPPTASCTVTVWTQMVSDRYTVKHWHPHHRWR